MSKLLAMMMKKNKEIFSNILDYDKTMFLCHFEQNLNNLGSDTQLYFADGGYSYNSDAKFGNYSVANYRYGMVWYQNNQFGYNKTLECWIKPISENFYFLIDITNNSWGHQAGFEIYNGWHLYGNGTKVFTAPEIFKMNDWNHIALTYSEPYYSDGIQMVTMTLWVNGEFCNDFEILAYTDIARFRVVGNSDNHINSCLIDELVVHNYVRYIKNFEVQHKSYVIGYEYYEVDYIETTGTQRIATGLYGSSTPLNNYSVEVDCVFYNANENAIIVNNWAANSYFLMAYGNACRWHGTPNVFDFGNLQLNVRYKIKIDVQNSLVYLDNTSYNCNPGNCGTAEIMLLGISDSTHSNKGFNGKIYRIKFYSPDGNLVRDYVPVYNSTLQQYCLLDKVENVFYMNKGTGTINGGND